MSAARFEIDHIQPRSRVEPIR
nr:hypothetical protein [Halomicronema sp. CCY15110]